MIFYKAMSALTEELVSKYKEILGNGDTTLIETRHDLASIIAEIDNIYWERIEKIIVSTIKDYEDRIVLNKYDRLITDIGILDPRLVQDYDGIRIQLLNELYKSPGQNTFYFSEWLANRLRLFLLYGELAEEKITRREGEDKSIVSYKEGRKKIYANLQHLFKNLPGFNAKSVQVLFEGKLDEAIDSLTAQLEQKEDIKIAEQRKQIIDIKTRMIARAREKATKQEEQELFDALNQIDKLIDEMKSALKPGQISMTRHITLEEKTNFIKAELRLVRKLLSLGVTGSGLTRTHSVFLSGEKRLTKSKISEIFHCVKEADPYLPETTNILIAPFVGVGFYEWDRDTVFVPLVPTINEEEAIVNGLSNYRLMLDNLRDGGQIKRAYETRFGREDSRSNFMRDYKSWVLGIGKGFRGSMDAQHYDFFKSYIGPNDQDMFAPVEIARLTPEERRKTITLSLTKINRAEGTWMDHYKVAVIHWKEGRASEALKEMAKAVKVNPVEGRIMFTLGYMCSSAGLNEKAKDAFKECIDISEGTIWSVYASNSYQKLQ